MTTDMGDSRIPDGWWEEHTDENGGYCPRCREPLAPGDEVFQEVLRCTAMEGGALALQGVAVHVECWEAGVGPANLESAKQSREARVGWMEMVARLRALEEDEEGEEWKL